MVIWRGYGLLLDACLCQGLAQLLDLQLLVSEPALQLDSPPLKSKALLSAFILVVSRSLAAGRPCRHLGEG